MHNRVKRELYGQVLKNGGVLDTHSEMQMKIYR